MTIYDLMWYHIKKVIHTQRQYNRNSKVKNMDIWQVTVSINIKQSPLHVTVYTTEQELVQQLYSDGVSGFNLKVPPVFPGASVHVQLMTNHVWMPVRSLSHEHRCGLEEKQPGKE